MSAENVICVESRGTCVGGLFERSPVVIATTNPAAQGKKNRPNRARGIFTADSGGTESEVFVTGKVSVGPDCPVLGRGTTRYRMELFGSLAVGMFKFPR